MQGTTNTPERTIGLDVGDRHSHLCVLDGAGRIVEESRIPTTTPALQARFGSMEPARVVLEVGPHSPWISRLLTNAGHEVIVANPRKLRLIYENDRKCDRADAEYLARVGRLDPELLAPVVHRSEDVQADLAVMRSRSALVDARTALVNHARSTVKAMGERLPKCSTATFPEKVEKHVPEALLPADLAGPGCHHGAQRPDPRDGAMDRRAGYHRVSGDGRADPGGRRRHAHGALLHAHPGDPGPLPEEPVRRPLPGPRPRPTRFGRVESPAPYDQGGRRPAPQAPDPVRSLHAWPLRSG